jgi:hypothetical protein
MVRQHFEMDMEAVERAIAHVAKQYKNPRQALREYVSNGVDNMKEGIIDGDFKSGLMNLLVSMPDRRVIIYDTGLGMDESFLGTMTERVWKSTKKGQSFSSGEKGVGLLAFASMGNEVDIVSRIKGESGYNHLNFKKMGEGFDERIIPDFERRTEDYVDNLFYGGFSHGTKVLVRTTPVNLRNSFSPRALRKFLQETYAPLLMKNIIGFYIGDVDKPDKTVELNAPVFKGDKIVKRTIPFTAGSRKNPEPGNAFVYLQFDPENDNGSVAFHEKDVRVWGSIADEEEALANCSLWTSPNVLGYINTEGIELTLDRNDPVTESRAYKNFRSEVLLGLESEFGDEIKKRTTRRHDDLEKKLLTEAVKLVQNGYAESGDPLDKKVIIRDPPPRPPKPPIDTPPTPPIYPEEPPITPGDPPNLPREPVKRKCPLSEESIEIIPFDPTKDHLRLELGKRFGDDVINVNKRCNSYAESQSKGKTAARNYIMKCFAHGVALYEMRNALAQGRDYGGPIEVSNEVINRAMSIAESAGQKKKK